MTTTKGSPEWYKEKYEQRFELTNGFQGSYFTDMRKYNVFLKKYIDGEFENIKEFKSGYKEGVTGFRTITAINKENKKQEYLGFVHPKTNEFYLGAPYILPVLDQTSGNVELMFFADKNLEDRIGSRIF